MDSETSESTNNNKDDNNNAGTIWFDSDKQLGPKVAIEDDNPVTRQEILDWIGKYADREIFEIRNLNTTKHEDEAQRIRKYQEYVRDNLR